MDFEPFGYGNRWFDRFETRRRRSMVVGAVVAVLAICFIVLFNR
jgi:allantoicase